MNRWDGSPPEGYEAARKAMQRGAKPIVVVAMLRLLYPCRVCGARPLQPCRTRRGGTHPARGEG